MMADDQDAELDRLFRLEAGFMMSEFFLPTTGEMYLKRLMGKSREEVSAEIKERCALAEKIAREAVTEYEKGRVV
jgi:hypothetical protein